MFSRVFLPVLYFKINPPANNLWLGATKWPYQTRIPRTAHGVFRASGLQLPPSASTKTEIDGINGTAIPWCHLPTSLLGFQRDIHASIIFHDWKARAERHVSPMEE